MEFDIKNSFMYIKALLNDMGCPRDCEFCSNYGTQECPNTARDLILDEIGGIEEVLYGE